MEKLEQIFTAKIDDLNYFDTIKDIKNSLLELKENVLNTEHSNKAIGKKVEELDSINQRKLDKVRKEQQKFIIEKIAELDGDKKIADIKKEIEGIEGKIQTLEKDTKIMQNEEFLQIKEYIEKRILRMRFATTIQNITKEIDELKENMSLVQETQIDKEEINRELENIINEQLQEYQQQFFEKLEEVLAEKTRPIVEETNILKKQINLLQKTQMKEKELRKNIEQIINEKIEEQQILENIEEIIDKRVQITINEMVKKQKAKKAQKALIEKKDKEYRDKLKAIQKERKALYESDTLKKKNKVMDTTMNTRKKTHPSSLDEMVATLSNTPNSKNSIASKTSKLAKAVKKSQLLNFDNYY